MKKINLLISTALFFGFQSCGSGEIKEQNVESIPQNKEEIIEIEYFKRLETKNEENGNSMSLYVINDTFNLIALKDICYELKENYGPGTFDYIVVFDFEENATFPKNPFTAKYGMDEEPQKHIKAIYEFNNQNGYSKLQVWDSNSWEGVAESWDI